MRRWLAKLRPRILLTLLTLFYLLPLLLAAIGWLHPENLVVPGGFLAFLIVLAAQLVFLLALLPPRTRPWARRMLLHSLALLSLATLYALLPGLPTSPRSTIKLVGYEGGQVMSPDATGRALVAPFGLALPLLIKVTSLPPTSAPPGPALPPEVRLIAAARFEQSFPYPEEWQNFFFPTVQLSLKNALAPAQSDAYFTEICYWLPAGDQSNPLQRGAWFCNPYEVRHGDPTRKGSGWVTVDGLKGFAPGGSSFYLFQYPRDWARANCEAAGGVFKTKADGFFWACTGFDYQRYHAELGRVVENPMREPPEER